MMLQGETGDGIIIFGTVNMSAASEKIAYLERVASNVPVFEKTEIGGIPISLLANFSDLYTSVKILGHGASGMVKCYREKSTSNLYAMKEMTIFRAEDLESLYGEVDILRELSESINSPSIVKYHDCFVRRSGKDMIFVIVTEYIEGACLQDYINAAINENKHFCMKTVLNIAYWLFDILAILHSRGYVHRDIKPNNIMVDHVNNRFVLIDFGLTCSINAKTSKSSNTLCTTGEFPGTVIFMAPESWDTRSRSRKRFTPRSGNKLDRLKLLDIWAAGVTIYMLAENKVPWTEKFANGIIGQITDKNGISYERSNTIKDVMDLALQKNPSERVHAEYIRDYIGTVVSNSKMK